MAEMGYGYTRSNVLNVANELAFHLGKRTPLKPLTEHWLDAFLMRHPQLKLMKARGLNELRAKGTSKEVMQHYFTGLGEVMEKYGLNDNPHRIYNVDEFGVTPENVPSKVS